MLYHSFSRKTFFKKNYHSPRLGQTALSDGKKLYFFAVT